jgi:hypothetical protein
MADRRKHDVEMPDDETTVRRKHDIEIPDDEMPDRGF